MLNTIQHDVAQIAIIKCSTQNGPFEIEHIKKIVQMAAMFSDYDGDLDAIIRYVESKVNCSMELGISVVSAEAQHDQDWIKVIKPEEKIYATAYERYLKDKGMGPSVVNSISRVNDSILSLMGNPRRTNYNFQRRGLVIGDVQSGKTSNYLSLLTKAADAGYKFIIVIAGIHNNLRSQTQQRIDEGFIGRISSIDRGKTPIGVAHFCDGAFPHPVSFTTVDCDFNKNLANSVATGIGNFNKPVILVIKKNVSTLRSLHDWLVNFNMNGAKSNGKINAPMLMIDDEADNASINTNDSDLDPTQTNSYIRTILKCFNQASYVGYTATPFANIFIDPNSYGDYEEDLFPKDFIYNLDAPTNYFGARKIFLNQDYKYIHVPLDSKEIGQHIPIKHKKIFIVKNIPESMKEAICCFLLAKCIRNLRKDASEHCSMLINVSTFKDVQIQLKNKVLDFLQELSEQILSFSAMPNALENKYIALLYQTFNKFYANAKNLDGNVIQWQQISAELRAMFDDSEKQYVFKTYAVNSSSPDSLDYSVQGKHGLMVIAIGGFSLSRGLTIEGLTVSYFYRSTQMYDTLLQMGRWFGYRPQYEDLCRIYMTEEAYSWYEHITMAAEDVRRQIAEMNQLKKTPKDFGLYVRASDVGLMITARNKMQSAESVELKRSFSGKLQEQTTFCNRSEIHAQNYEALEELWNTLSKHYLVEQYGTGAFFKDVNISTVIELFKQYRFGSEQEVTESHVLMDAATRYLVEIQLQHPNIDVVFRSRHEAGHTLNSFADIRAIERNKVMKKGNENYQLNKSRLGSNTDEAIGLNKEQIAQADKATGKEYRKIRNKPLLIMYLVELSTQEDEVQEEEKLNWNSKQELGYPALSLSFPYMNADKSVQIYANRIYMDSNTVAELQEEE
ncbi:Z1 domain-containing protein [Acinetobacter sp. 256-1]|uniref:Z1 domain-containing protein n=1 Tax=Acinetobacter sp. 256-1 TaxID=2746721 RepID=UPI0025777B52|nr:Z1 domain-containing protein [Acinetobacter sp. 256-1]MDM1757675.1 Z1 domain-containing protein [Acinetobacter sp. 256-1]